jgi:thiol:disulfide interchange protein
VKNLLPLLVLCLLSVPGVAQVLQPAQWTVTPSVTSAKAGDVIDIRFSATIDKSWYLYSNDFECPDGDGPNKTEITFVPHASYELVGNVVAVNPTKKHDVNFDCEVTVFKGKGEFVQKVRLLGSPIQISGKYDYQVCSDITFVCVTAGEDFSITNIAVAGGVNAESAAVVDPFGASANPLPTSAEAHGPVLDPAILDGEATIREESLLGYLLFAFILGLTSLITPCVFPMVPMTVTFFLRDNQTKKEGVRKAIIFGLSIILIYTLAGTLFAVVLGAEGLNALATHWAPNLFVFVAFIVFALSFFGLFEINAPYQLVNKADAQAEKGGLIGIFFMAATLVLVSFSCTLPIVGNVVVLAAGGQVLKPVLAMFSYSLAFSIPFTLFAIFPEWIKGLPKSGGWLNSVKVSLGFLELALCLKFFSIADQAYHWGLLDRDVNLALWIVIFGLFGVYILGKLPMKGDTPVEHVTVPRLLFSMLIFSFVVYLVPGLWGAPLKSLAGYLPPMYTHDFNLAKDASRADALTGCEPPKYSDFLHLPHGLSGYFDYEQALACAREQRKPLFIDFTGHGCTNCREMEAVVWSDPAVLRRLSDDFVVVALYVDDKTLLPEADWYVSSNDNKEKKTIGKQNADLQITYLNNNAQPFYVLVGADERVLAWPYGYDRDPVKFLAFLERGKAKYKSLYP